MNDISFHVNKLEDQTGDKPVIVFGFTGEGFSQAVLLAVSDDPTVAVRNADIIYKAYIDACGEATKAWKNAHTKTDDDKSAEPVSS